MALHENEQVPARSEPRSEHKTNPRGPACSPSSRGNALELPKAPDVSPAGRDPALGAVAVSVSVLPREQTHVQLSQAAEVA